MKTTRVRRLLVLTAAALLTPTGVARGAEGTSAEHSDAMNKGQTHDEAVEATKAKPKAKAKGKKAHGTSAAHSAAMGAGKTHEEAIDATKEPGGKGSAAEHSKAMNTGKTHDDAVEATKSKGNN